MPTLNNVGNKTTLKRLPIEVTPFTKTPALQPTVHVAQGQGSSHSRLQQRVNIQFTYTKYCIPSSIQYVVLSDFINIFCGKNFIHFGACGFRIEPILTITSKGVHNGGDKGNIFLLKQVCRYLLN